MFLKPFALAGPERRHLHGRRGTSAFTFDLAAQTQLRIADVVSALGLSGAPEALVFDVEGGASDGLFVGVRTSSVTAEGHYGVFYAAVPSTSLASGRATIPGLLQDATNRSNVAIVNAGAVPARFRITALSAAGTPRGSLEVELGPSDLRQIGSILYELAPDATAGSITVEMLSGEGPFLAYGVVNDGSGPGRGTGDGTFVEMHVP